MMSASEKEGGVPGYNVIQPTILPSNPVQPNAIPVNFQWNMNPVQAGPNGYPGAQVWNVSMPPSQIIFQNNSQQWTVQPLPPAYTGPPAMPPTMLPATFPATPQDTRLSALHKTFLKGKPYALGIVLIVTSILEIAFGFSLCFLMISPSVLSGILFWGPIFYIIAGSLSISAHKTLSICKIKGALTLNIISSICSMVTIILNILDFSVVKCDANYYFCSDEHGSGGFTVISFILVMNWLIFSVSVSISVFGCRAVKEIPVTAPPMFVIQNDYVVSMPPSTLTSSTTDPTDQPAQPPPYEEEKKEKPEI